MDDKKAFKTTFQATTFKAKENSRTFQGLSQKLRSFQRKMEFKDFSRTSPKIQGLPLKFKYFSRLCEPVFIIGLLTCRCNTSCFLKLPQDLLSHTRVSMVVSCIVFIVSVPFLLIPFTVIRACMEAGGRKKPSTDRIRALPFSWSSGQWQ